MSNFEVVKGDSQEGEVFNKLIESSRPRFDYDGLVKAYNDLEPDSKDLLKFEYPPASMTNFSAMLESRGLEKNKDYEASGLTSKADGNYYIFLRRKSTTEGYTLGEKRSTQDESVPSSPAEDGGKQGESPSPTGASPAASSPAAKEKPAQPAQPAAPVTQAPPAPPKPEEDKPVPPKPTEPAPQTPPAPPKPKPEAAPTAPIPPAPPKPKGSNPPAPEGQKPPPPPAPPKPSN